jgi:hypothetical protein
VVVTTTATFTEAVRTVTAPGDWHVTENSGREFSVAPGLFDEVT